jgi:hypothetical protein
VTTMDIKHSDSGQWSPQSGDGPSQMMEAKEVEHLLRTLHQSWDHGEVRSAMMRVSDLFPQCECNCVEFQ